MTSKSKKKPDTATELAALLAETGMTQVELAKLTAVDQSMISRYLAGRDTPGPLASLMFAGCASSTGARAFWLAKAGIHKTQIDVLRKAVGLDIKLGPGSYDSELTLAFLGFWKTPQNDVRESLKDFLEKMVFSELPPRDATGFHRD